MGMQPLVAAAVWKMLAKPELVLKSGRGETLPPAFPK